MRLLDRAVAAKPGARESGVDPGMGLIEPGGIAPPVERRR
jgi:hypothetical protein